MRKKTCAERRERMDDKKLLFIYNPRAGKGQIRNNLLDIIDTFVKAGYVVTARPTQYAGEAVELAADRTAKYDLVVCSGGDGTLDEVVTGIMKRVFDAARSGIFRQAAQTILRRA